MGIRELESKACAGARRCAVLSGNLRGETLPTAGNAHVPASQRTTEEAGHRSQGHSNGGLLPYLENK